MPDKNDEEDKLWVPAGPFRVVFGLSLMTGGSVLGLIGCWKWLNVLGWILFCASFLIMLKPAEQRVRTKV